MAEKLSVIFKSASGPPSGPGASLTLKGSLKSRREGQAAALSLLTPEDLRARRQALGLSQKKLADEVGVTATLIGLIELGKRGLSLELAQKILAVLKD
jgi:DNA-binding XRE family transcriptional regulator